MQVFTRTVVVLILLMAHVASFAQAPKKWTSADIHEAIQKLNFLGSALYVAAHPDDENTRLISYLANELKANTAYLSLTRGDGGQNLVGSEISELLGIIRTQELLAARRIDGGNQMFSRANDFGYSKHPDETLKIWQDDEVLGDVVWAIRKWQPDVIINRFDHKSAGQTHGHHTASAMLSFEAFDMANDKDAYPEQLKYVEAWQPQRLFFNTSWWFYGSQENFEKADKSNMLNVDVGVYYPIMGKSNTEIAAESRSMHKSQGFGSTGSRGIEMEYLELLKGDLPPEKDDIFAGINTTWSRVEGGEPIGKILSKVEKEFRYNKPYESLDGLLEAYQLIQKLPKGYWKKVKEGEIKEVIKACLALFAEAVANDYSATPGQGISVDFEFTNRSPIGVTLEEVHYLPLDVKVTYDHILANNHPFTGSQELQLPKEISYTNAYWLNKEHDLGMYIVENQLLRGLPETPRQLKIGYTLKIKGMSIPFEQEVVYKRNDPVDGEVYRPFEITPPVFANLAEKVYVFGNNSPKMINVLVKSGKENISGTLELCHGDGWKVEPEHYDFELKLKGQEQYFSFKLYPPEKQDENFVSPLIKMDGETYTKELISIEYDHIPTQMIFQNSSAKVARIDLQKAGDNVAYIMGAGDEIPASLRQIGYDVTLLEDQEINKNNLKNYDAVILGVRAYNTNDRLKFHQEALLNYVKEGGTLIVQYNTNRGLKVPMEEIAPYQLNISRDRVTVEEAEVRMLKPEHPVLNWPNKITEKDFEGWVQERGLYFPDEWDKEHFTAILSANDPDETPKDGGFLVAKYGDGYYIYSGYSWFRELPAGVPGAFRIFANMISIGKEAKP